MLRGEVSNETVSSLNSPYIMKRYLSICRDSQLCSIFKMSLDKLTLKRKVAIGVAIALTGFEEKQKKRKWSKNWFLQRKKFSHMPLLQELRYNEPKDYLNYLRMDEEKFYYILNLIRPYIEKKNTVFREAVSAEERLVVTLRYLATGRTYEDLKFSCAISPQLLGQIIPETCWAIYNCLKENYLKFPSTEEEWNLIAKEFNYLWQFYNCVGAIDGKHIQITKPANSGSYYYNYKGTFSVVLMAIVSANYEFLMIHCGTNGRVSDGGVLNQTTFYQKLIGNQLKLPHPTEPKDTNLLLPFTFIGDQAFPLLDNLMKPYPDKNLTREEKIFNYRLSRARRVSENAFGIMASRFRVFHSLITINVRHVDALVLASCALHNFLRRSAPNRYIPPLYADSEDTTSGEIIPGQWRTVGELIPLQRRARASNLSSRQIRDNFKNYFNNTGALDFQEKMAFRKQ